MLQPFNTEHHGTSSTLHDNSAAQGGPHGHSTDGFPTRTGQEFIDFLRAAATGDPSAFWAVHPATLAFVQTRKPSPASFATEVYFGVTAFRFINVCFKLMPDNHRFHDSLDSTFGSGQALAEYDEFHKMFKVNRLLAASRE